jgi:hypothetical protein
MEAPVDGNVHRGFSRLECKSCKLPHGVFGACPCVEKGNFVRRRIAVWFIGSALLAAVVFLVGCSVSTSVKVTSAKHVSYAAGTACNAANCHTQYKHEKPYLGACSTCHHSLVSWKQVTYTHKDPTFDNGMHSLVGCSTCHTEGQALPSGGCSTCHDSPHGGWNGCSSCHTTVAWGLRKPLPSNHLSLAGGHSTLACTDCHKSTTEPATARKCVDCHGTHHGGLRNCQDCHDPSRGWKPKANFNHDTFFKLVGIHKTLQCAQCHTNGKFAGTPRVCVGCHGKHHGGLTDCASCHTTSSFKPSTFKHSSVFVLTGQHTKLACTSCHPKKRYAHVISGGSHRCVACHGKQHGGLTNCASCHTTSSFKPSTFKHSSVFVLTGQHKKLACTSCHPKKRYAHVISGGSHRCVACHGKQHGGLSNCASCHTTKGFESTTFKHSSVFVLTGQHAKLASEDKCYKCHPGNAFTVVAGTKCVDCHGSSSPHGSSVTKKCQTCHTTAGFDQVSSYPAHPITLGTEHSSRACTLCHTSLVFSDATKSCSSCHTAPHVGPTDCLDCHTPTTWSDTTFTHPVITGFGETAPHYYTDFGSYPSGCVECHTSSSSIPDFTAYSCTAAGCHQ